MKFNALIVDDEMDAATALRLLLEKTCDNVKITGICLSVVEAIKFINKEQIDILFLDIEMPGGDGFDLLEILKNKMPYVIFTTAHHEYAIKAIKYGARDYLLKPLDPDELVAAIQKASEHLNKNEKNSIPSASLSSLAVRTNKEILFLNKEDILYIRADGRYSEIVCKSDRRYNICKNIGELEAELGGDSFFRVHKSYLINCKHILKINSNDGGFIEMCDQKEIEISRRKKAEFLHFLK